MSMYYNYITRGGNSVVECLLAKEDVASSSLVSRSIKKSPSKGSFLLRFFHVKMKSDNIVFNGVEYRFVNKVVYKIFYNSRIA